MQNIDYHVIAAEDHDEYPMYKHFDECTDLIKQAHDNGKNVLVHCAMGKSRSASIVIAYLIKYKQMTMEQALKHAKERRPVVLPNPGFIKQLQDYQIKWHAAVASNQWLGL